MTTRILIICEGESEEELFKNIQDKIFGNKSPKIILISIPVRENIYMLADKIRDDEFLDTIKLVRDLPSLSSEAAKRLDEYKSSDFTEIYLFFDLDPHDTNYAEEHEKFIKNMLDIFDNETYHGKLYINYPMLEAIKDINLENPSNSKCVCNFDEVSHYKENVSKSSKIRDYASYNYLIWKIIIQHALKKANYIVYSDSCRNNVGFYAFPANREEFINELTQDKIYKAQLDKFLSKERVATLSSIPLFLLEYKNEKFWLDIIHK